MMFDWDKFKNQEFMVSFSSQKEVIEFLRECEKLDIKPLKYDSYLLLLNRFDLRKNLLGCFDGKIIEGTHPKIVKWSNCSNLLIGDVLNSRSLGQVFEFNKNIYTVVKSEKDGRIDLLNIEHGYITEIEPLEYIVRCRFKRIFE